MLLLMLLLKLLLSLRSSGSADDDPANAYACGRSSEDDAKREHDAHRGEIVGDAVSADCGAAPASGPGPAGDLAGAEAGPEGLMFMMDPNRERRRKAWFSGTNDDGEGEYEECCCCCSCCCGGDTEDDQAKGCPCAPGATVVPLGATATTAAAAAAGRKDQDTRRSGRKGECCCRD